MYAAEVSQVPWRSVQTHDVALGATRIWDAATLVLLIEGIFKIGCWDRFVWCDIRRTYISWRLVQAFKQYSAFASVMWVGVMLVILIGGYVKCAIEMGFKCHDIHTKFHRDWFNRSKVNKGNTHTHTVSWFHELTFPQNKETWAKRTVTPIFSTATVGFL
jgi:hypothetical protein